MNKFNCINLSTLFQQHFYIPDFCNNYKNLIKAKLVFYLNHVSEISGEEKSHMKSSLISGSTIAHSSWTHFKHNIQQTYLSSLAESKKVSRQKINYASSSSFALWTSILLYLLIFLVFKWASFGLPLPYANVPPFH
jgi:hypothetical protein